MGSVNNLKMLYLLTFADVKAVGSLAYDQVSLQLVTCPRAAPPGPVGERGRQPEVARAGKAEALHLSAVPSPTDTRREGVLKPQERAAGRFGRAGLRLAAWSRLVPPRERSTVA